LSSWSVSLGGVFALSRLGLLLGPFCTGRGLQVKIGGCHVKGVSRTLVSWSNVCFEQKERTKSRAPCGEELLSPAKKKPPLRKEYDLLLRRKPKRLKKGEKRLLLILRMGGGGKRSDRGG